MKEADMKLERVSVGCSLFAAVDVTCWCYQVNEEQEQEKRANVEYMDQLRMMTSLLLVCCFLVFRRCKEK